MCICVYKFIERHIFVLFSVSLFRDLLCVDRFFLFIESPSYLILYFFMVRVSLLMNLRSFSLLSSFFLLSSFHIYKSYSACICTLFPASLFINEAA